MKNSIYILIICFLTFMAALSSDNENTINVFTIASFIMVTAYFIVLTLEEKL